MLLAVLAHVDADHRPLVVEEILGQRAGEFRLADPGGSQENERADWPVRIGKPERERDHRFRHEPDGLFLPDHALVQFFFQLEQLAHLAFEQLADGDARPRLTTSAMSSSSPPPERRLPPVVDLRCLGL